MDEFKPLRDILRAAGRRLPPGWLYLPADRKWTLETPALMIDHDILDESEMVDEDTPVVARFPECPVPSPSLRERESQALPIRRLRG
jgi:hypothetical protein